MYVAKNRVFKWKQLGYKSWQAYLKDYNKRKMRAWYLKNKEQHLEKCREYRDIHREERAYREWYRKTYLKK